MSKMLISYVYICLVFIIVGASDDDSAFNPCCSFPCQNRGVCMTQGYSNYACDCTNTEFFGKNCEIPTWQMTVKLWLKPSSETQHYLLTHYEWLWNIINRIGFLRDFLMKTVYRIRADVVDSPALYNSDHEYITLDVYYNRSQYQRALPPVPKNCPTPMGTKGRKQLPDANEVANKLLKRTEFLPDRINSSVLFAFFAQHFTHMFFKTDMERGGEYTWGNHGVDVSSIYGETLEKTLKLRNFVNGKFKMQTINGEAWPCRVDELHVDMTYPPGFPDSKKFALGHPFYGLLPGLFVWSTIWMREHNRVCDVLKIEHPEWDDEQLFQTARLIILGETIKIVIEDYVQHLSQYNFRLKFDPELLHDVQYQYQNRIALEFNHLYHWHPLLPENFIIADKTYPMNEYMFNSQIVVDHGMSETVDSMSRQIASRMSHHNHGKSTLYIAVEAIKHGRTLRLQPFNEYRKRFGLPAYISFFDLTGDAKLAKQLEELYGHVDAVEFYVGLLVEKPRPRAMFGGTIVEMGGPFSVKGLMSSPLCSPGWWKPSTFGGDVGFDIAKTATLEKLFCLNINGECPLVTFKVPEENTVDSNTNKEEL